MIKKKLLIFDHASYLPGGHTPQRHFEIARNLSLNNIAVTLIGSSYDHRSGRKIKFSRFQFWCSEYVSGVRFVWLRLPAYGSLRARILNMVLYPLAATICLLSGYLGKADCVIGSSPHIFAPIAARIAAFFMRARFVFEVRDLWPDSIIEILGVDDRSISVAVLRRLEKYLFESADYVVSVLPNIERYVSDRSYCLLRQPIWIANGVDVTSIPYTPPVNNKFKLIYFGAVGPANSVDVILTIWRHVELKVNDLDLEIIGDGPSLVELRKVAESKGLKRVKFLGFIKNKDAFYERAAQATAFVMSVPNRKIYAYGVGANKLAEYLSFGRPIIYIGAGLSTELLEKDFVLHIDFDKDGVEDAAIKMIMFFESLRENIWRYSSSARQMAEKNYSYRQLSTLFEKICFSEVI